MLPDGVQPWLYPPDGGVLERLEWRTDVLTAFEGSEQRIRLRRYPRRRFELRHVLTGRDRREADNRLQRGLSRRFAVPVWMDSQFLSAGVSSGADVLAIDTTTRDFHVGGYVAVLRSPSAFEIGITEAVAADSITLVDGLTASWPAGARVVPLRLAALPEDLALDPFDGDTSTVTVQASCRDDSDLSFASETLAYRSLPVLETRPNWSRDVSQRRITLLDEIDFGIAQPFRDTRSTGAISVRAHGWTLDGRTAIHAFRQWLYARAGRLSAFWSPSWQQDLRVVANIGSSATTIDIEHCGYTAQVAQDTARRDLRIARSNGTVQYRRITGSTEISSTVERITINTALGTALAAGDVAAVSFLQASRLDGDAAEILWRRHDWAEAQLNIRGLRNDL